MPHKFCFTSDIHRNNFNNNYINNNNKHKRDNDTTHALPLICIRSNTNLLLECFQFLAETQLIKQQLRNYLQIKKAMHM